MGVFDIFKKAAKPAKPEALEVVPGSEEILAPVTGKIIPLGAVGDPVFSSGVMGKGCGIEPAQEVLYAPVSGTLSAIGAPNYHAVGIVGDGGAEILIHVGVDTVEMRGEGFTVYVEKGMHVEAGEPLLSFSKRKIAAAGHDTVVIMVLTNTDGLSSVELAYEGNTKAGNVVIRYTG